MLPLLKFSIRILYDVGQYDNRVLLLGILKCNTYLRPTLDEKLPVIPVVIHRVFRFYLYPPYNDNISAKPDIIALSK